MRHLWCPRCGSGDIRADYRSHKRGDARQCSACRFEGDTVAFTPTFKLNPTEQERLDFISQLVYRWKDSPRWASSVIASYEDLRVWPASEPEVWIYMTTGELFAARDFMLTPQIFDYYPGLRSGTYYILSPSAAYNRGNGDAPEEYVLRWKIAAIQDGKLIRVDDEWDKNWDGPKDSDS